MFIINQTINSPYALVFHRSSRTDKPFGAIFDSQLRQKSIKKNLNNPEKVEQYLQSYFDHNPNHTYQIVMLMSEQLDLNDKLKKVMIDKLYASDSLKDFILKEPTHNINLLFEKLSLKTIDDSLATKLQEPFFTFLQDVTKFEKLKVILKYFNKDIFYENFKNRITKNEINELEVLNNISKKYDERALGRKSFFISNLLQLYPEKHQEIYNDLIKNHHPKFSEEDLLYICEKNPVVKKEIYRDFFSDKQKISINELIKMSRIFSKYETEIQLKFLQNKTLDYLVKNIDAFKEMPTTLDKTFELFKENLFFEGFSSSKDTSLISVSAIEKIINAVPSRKEELYEKIIKNKEIFSLLVIRGNAEHLINKLEALYPEHKKELREYFNNPNLIHTPSNPSTTAASNNVSDDDLIDNYSQDKAKKKSPKA